ncbi:MAG: DNA polymerase III subunit beta [Ilumatobacteraceae bacterium]
MKFRCERDVLAEAFGASSRAATGRATNPTLSCLRLVLAGSQLRVTGTDGDLTIEATVEVAGTTDGVALVPAKLASEVVRSLPSGAVEIELSGDKVLISAGRVNFTVPVGAEGDFPKWTGSVGSGVTVPAAELAEALKQVVRAASTDDARGVLTGVLVTSVEGVLRLVATDSYRLAIRDIKAAVLPDGSRFVVPARALGELQRLLGGAENVSIDITENDATFAVGNMRLVTRLISGTFADYQRLIPPSPPNQLVIGRDALLDAIRRVKLVARDPIGTPLRIRMDADGVTLRMISQDSGEAVENIEAELSGNEIEMSFNNELLAAGIDACSTETVSIQTSEPGKLAVIRPVVDGNAKKADYTYLLMPLRS